MRLKPEAILLIFFSYLSYRIYTIIPESDQTFDFFPLYDGDQAFLTLRTHVWIISDHLSRLFFIRAIYVSVAGTKWPLDAFFILEAMDMVDYMMIYNEPWGKIANFSVEFGDIKLGLMSSVFILYLYGTRNNGTLQ